MKHKNIFRMLAVVLTLALLLVAIPASPALAAAYTVNVDPDEGTIGDTIRVYGDGPPLQEIFIYFSSQNADVGDDIDTHVTAYEWLTSTTIHSLTETYNVPSLEVPPVLKCLTASTSDDELVHGGIYYIYITREGNKDIKAKTTFTVTGVAEITDFDPDEGTVGTEVEIAGEGFAPDEAIIVEYDGDEIDIESGDEEAGSDGKFELTIIIPPSEYGENTITVRGEESLAELDVIFFVIPEIIIDPETGEAGTLVTIVGTGFDRYNDVIISFDGDEVKTKRTGSDGSFDTYFTVPEVDAGPYTVIAEDEDDDDIWVEAEFTVIVFIPPLNPDIIINPTSGNVGDEVTVSGTEFGNNKPITLYLDNVAITPTAPITTGSTGSFSGTFVIPAIAGGSHIIKAEDNAAHSATATLTVEPEMSMAPLTGFINDEIAVSGTGFGANKNINIMYGTTVFTPTAPITTGPEGSFSGSFLVTAIPGGSRTLTVTDGTNSLTAVFTMKASIIVNPTSGIIGSGVGVGGYGFGASKPITILFNNSPVTLLAPITTSPEGTFSNAQFYVPAGTAGAATITITITDGINSVNTSYTVLAATASISPTKGSTETTITVSGTNFAAGGTVTIKYYMAAGSTTGDFEEFTATVTSTGVLSTTFDVPASEGGNHAIIISDGTNSISANFTVETSDISISPKTSTASPGYIGMEISISGDGYAADAPIEVTYDGAALATDADKTDDNGSFTADFTIPPSAGGEHTITVSIDGVAVEQFTFIMESTPPSAPIQMLIWVGNRAEQPISLDWQAVGDNSPPITYNLQIATDSSFVNIVKTWPGLSESEYTLTEAEKLEPVSKKTPYYWRVNAVDGAGNISAWSDADSFYIGGGWPSWLTYLLIGLGALVVFVLALWLGRRTAFSSY